MVELVLHIGPHKTGSTYIQKTLVAESERLMQDYAIVYPTAGRGVLFGHHGLYQMIATKKDLTEISEKLKLEYSRAEKVILSSESFSLMTKSQITTLIDLFAPSSIKVIFFYRNWTQLLYSSWQELIKHGKTLLFQEFCLRNLLEPHKSRLLNFGKVIDDFAAVVGMKNIAALSYNTIEGEAGDIFDSLLHVVCPTFESLREKRNPRRVNPRADSHLIEAIRVLNSISKQQGRDAGSSVRKAYVALLNNDEAKQRHADLAHIMEPFVQSLEDYGQSRPAKIFFKQFQQKYEDILTNPVELRIRHVNVPEKMLPKIVHPDYLFNPEAVQLIRMSWSAIDPILATVKNNEIIPTQH